MPGDIPFADPKDFKIDHDVMSPVDHFKLLVTQLDAFKNDYVNREIRAGALGAKYLRGVAKSKAAGALAQYGQYVNEVGAFADHINVIRGIMFEVWEKLTPEEQKEFSKFQNDLKKS